jgi:hypothetical protein
MKYVSYKNREEDQRRHFMSNIFFLENIAVYEIMWENMVQVDRPQMSI